MKISVLVHSVLLPPDTGKIDEPFLPNGGAIAQCKATFYFHKWDTLFIVNNSKYFIFYDFYIL